MAKAQTELLTNCPGDPLVIAAMAYAQFVTGWLSVTCPEKSPTELEEGLDLWLGIIRSEGRALIRMDAEVPGSMH
jgi:hypothetical protein